MRYLTFVCALIVLVFSNCKDNTEDQPATAAEVEDSTEKLDTIFSGRDINFLSQLKASKYASAKNAPIDWSKFRSNCYFICCIA